MRRVKLEPGSSINIFRDPAHVKIEQADKSKELWIDINTATCPQENHGKPTQLHPKALDLDGITQAIVTDWDGAYHQLHEFQIEWVEQLSELVPTKWLTMNNYVDTTADWKTYGWCWNRTKAAYTEGIIGPKYGGGIANYVQYPFYTAPRNYKILSTIRQNYPYRRQLAQFLEEQNSCLLGNTDTNPLLPNIGTAQDLQEGLTALPAKRYLDSSYISCQVESQHIGRRGVLFSEKTYDHLIQGRCVLNFCSSGYYRELMNEGWMFPPDIDFSWDATTHDRHRFQGYLDTLERLLSITDMHGWFMSHQNIWAHNQQMLWNKSYDIIE